MRRSKRSAEACASSRRHYDKKRTLGLVRAALWISRDNEHLLTSLRKIDWVNRVTADEILSALRIERNAPPTPGGSNHGSPERKTEAPTKLDIPGQTVFGFSDPSGGSVPSKAEVQETPTIQSPATLQSLKTKSKCIDRIE